MSIDDNTVVYVVIALAIVALVIVAAFVSQRRARARSAELQRQFGPEYDRALEQAGSRAKAERALLARARRVNHFRFQELSSSDRLRFEATWTRIQAQFVDDPAVVQHYRAAHELSQSANARNGQINTEDLRQAVVHYRVLFAELLQESSARAGVLRDAHA